MGGFGSGRRANPRQRKTRVEDCIVLNIDFLVRNGLIERGRAHRRFNGHPTSPDALPPFFFDVVLDDAQFPKGPPYTGQILRITRSRPIGGRLVQEGMQFVDLQASRVHRGGKRLWFTCPGHRSGSSSTCSRRVGALHLPPGNMEFRCRHCLGLSYKSKQTSRGDGSLSSQHTQLTSSPPWEGARSDDVFPTVELPEDTPEPLRRGLRSPEDTIALVGTLATIQAELRRMGYDESSEMWSRLTAFAADLVRTSLR